MEIFRTIKMLFNLAGFYKPLAIHSSFLNVKNVALLITIFVNIILFGMFLVFDANNFGECCECFYTLVTCINMFIILNVEFIRKTSHYWKLIADFEDTIRKRKTFIQFIY